MDLPIVWWVEWLNLIVWLYFYSYYNCKKYFITNQYSINNIFYYTTFEVGYEQPLNIHIHIGNSWKPTLGVTGQDYNGDSEDESASVEYSEEYDEDALESGKWARPKKTCILSGRVR